MLFTGNITDVFRWVRRRTTRAERAAFDREVMAAVVREALRMPIQNDWSLCGMIDLPARRHRPFEQVIVDVWRAEGRPDIGERRRYVLASAVCTVLTGKPVSINPM